MAWAIFKETWRRDWRQILYWGIGLGIIGLFIMLAIPNVDMLEQYAALFEDMSPALLQMFGISGSESIATPEGFIAYGYFLYATLLLGAFSVITGLSITASDEENGTMDVLLALPVARWRIIVEKYIAYAIMGAIILMIGSFCIFLGSFGTDLEVNWGTVIEGTINAYPPVLLMLAFTTFIGGWLGGRGRVTMIAAAFIIGSYFLNFLGRAATDSFAEPLGLLSFFYYSDAQAVVDQGLQVGNVLLLTVSALILLALSVWFWQRRDVGV